MPTEPKGKFDRPVQGKGVVDYFAEQGIEIHYAYARAIIKACPKSIRARYVIAQDAWSFWVLNPSFKPFAEKHPGAGSTRDLSEMGKNS